MPASGRYKSAAAVAAINIPKQTFNRWLDRRIIGLAPDDIPGVGRGKPRRFGMRTITKLAIAHRISLLNVPANTAVTLASKFTDEAQCGRPLGGLFPVGLTFIVVNPGGLGAVVNLKPEEDIGTIIQDASMIVNINAVISQINFEVGIPK